EQRLADAGQQLDRLGHLDRADARAQYAQHAALGAGRHHAGWRRFWVQAAVARALLGPEHARLPVEAGDRTPGVGLPQEDGRVVDHVPGREVVGAVDDQIVLGEDLQHVVVAQRLAVDDHVHVRINFAYRVARRLRLRPADVGLAVDDLALQVGLVDGVEL